MSIKLNSALGGSVTLNEPATASAFTLTLPTDNIQPGMNLITPISVVGGTFTGGAISFNAATSVSVNGCFTSTYANYIIYLHQSARSVSGDTNIRMRSNGIDTTTSTYQYSQIRFGRPSFIVDGSAVTTTSFPANYGAAGNTEYRIINILNAAISGQVGFDLSTFSTDAGNLGYHTNAICTQATAHDGFTYYPSAGNVTGTMRIYGLRNQ